MKARIDLHVHMDGSIPMKTAREILQQADIHMAAEELKKRMEAPVNCRDLAEYLSVFSLPLSLMQSREGIALVSEHFHAVLESQGIWYAEPRFALSSLTAQGLSQEEVLESALEGRARFYRAHPEAVLHTNFLICAMRGEGEKNARDNAESFEIAGAYLGKGVAGVDLAGAEALYPTENYRSLFQQARDQGLPFTIHAGEAAGPESVWQALSFGAKRIGHGVRSIEDEKLVETLVKEGVTLELCPTSNIQTRNFSSYEEHALGRLLAEGVRCTINTDNMTVSGTTLQAEFAHMRHAGMLTDAMEETLFFHAADAIFGTEAEKKRLRTLYQSESLTE